MSGANTRTHTWKAENTKEWKAQNQNKNRNRMDLKLKGNEWENVKEIKFKEEKRSGSRARAFIHKENVKSLKPNWSSANKNWTDPAQTRIAVYENANSSTTTTTATTSKKRKTERWLWSLTNQRDDFQAIWMLENTMYCSSGRSAEEEKQEKKMNYRWKVRCNVEANGIPVINWLTLTRPA